MLKNMTFKHRLIGAIFIISLGIIIIPAVFDSPALDTLTVKESLPAEPEHAQWQDLQEIEYSFTELVGDLQAEEGHITESLESLAQQAPVNDEPADETIMLAQQSNTLAPVVNVTPQSNAPVEAATVATAAPTTAATPTPTPTTTPTTTPVASPKPTIAPVQAEDVVASTEKLIANNTWAVQLGAFSKTENAQNLVESLKSKGYAAYIHQMADSKLSRVLVGVEADQNKAAALLSELDQSMHLKGILIKFNPEDAS
jgi:DedD protein